MDKKFYFTTLLGVSTFIFTQKLLPMLEANFWTNVGFCIVDAGFFIAAGWVLDIKVRWKLLISVCIFVGLGILVCKSLHLQWVREHTPTLKKFDETKIKFFYSDDELIPNAKLILFRHNREVLPFYIVNNIEGMEDVEVDIRIDKVVFGNNIHKLNYIAPFLKKSNNKQIQLYTYSSRETIVYGCDHVGKSTATVLLSAKNYEEMSRNFSISCEE